MLPARDAGISRQEPEMSVVGRRAVMRCGLILVAVLAVSAHTPYRQWDVYRMKHLLIGTSREDAASYPVGSRLRRC